MNTQPRTLYWQQQLDDWLGSGLSGAAFCKQHELAYHQFTYWRGKLLTGDSQSCGDPPEN